MLKQERFDNIIEFFKKNRPDVETELQYSDPYELIVAVILSAQCTDKRVNIITPELLKKYPSAEKLSRAKIPDVYEIIKSCSYPNSKAKYLVGMAETLIKKFNGNVPSDLSDLQKLPGVGRKSANVIASVIFGKPVLAVDTHVFRVSARLGLSTNCKTPIQTESQLVKYIPTDLIPIAHHWLVLHGRYICQARKPKCLECGVRDFCKYYEKLSLD